MKAISPVIATVIIVAVAISVSIAVALWLTGLTTTFTGLEKLEIVSAYPVKYDNPINGTYAFAVNVTIRNTGTGTATIQEVFINGKPHETIGAKIRYIKGTTTIEPGKTTILTIYLPKTYTSGQTIEIKIHTAAGKDYPKTITLP